LAINCSSTGTWKIEIYALEENSGNYKLVYNEAGTQRGINISAAAALNGSYGFIGIVSKFIKIVPTIGDAGTLNYSVIGGN
jgi:hypothetical protein